MFPESFFVRLNAALHDYIFLLPQTVAVICDSVVDRLSESYFYLM